MEQTKNEAGLEAGRKSASTQPSNQVINTSVNVSPYHGGQWNVNAPVHPPQLPYSPYAAVGTIPVNQKLMGNNHIPGQNLYRERERDRTHPGQRGWLPNPPLTPVMNSAQHGLCEWDCPACNGHNYVSQFNCFKCGLAKPTAAQAKRPGDWYCSNCSAHNYASRDLCFKCHKNKQPGTESVSYGGNRRPGDWDCPSCKAHNYASRDACFRCSIMKPPGLAVIVGSRRPGDWDCIKCRVHNYASRTVCFKCEAQKPRPVVPPQLPIPMFTQLPPQYPWSMLPLMHHAQYPLPNVMLPHQPPPPLVMRPTQFVQTP